MNLLQKLHKIQSDIDYLTKDKDGHQYRYVTGTKVLSAIRPKMNELNIILKQEITDTSHETITYSTRNGEKTEVLAKVKFRFTWVDVESGETDVNEWAADGMNGFDKGIGSAMTYAERYFLLKYFHIPTDELDNDALGEKIGEGKSAEQRLMSATSLSELQRAWLSLSKSEMAKHTDLKETLKKTLK